MIELTVFGTCWCPSIPNSIHTVSSGRPTKSITIITMISCNMSFYWRPWVRTRVWPSTICENRRLYYITI